MSLDTKIRRAVQKVVHTVGTTVTIRRVTTGTYSPTLGTLTNPEVDYAVVGRLDDYTDRELVQTSVKAGDRKLTLAAMDLAFVPVVHDKAVIDDVVFDIVRVVREMAQNLPAMYVLQLRR